MDGVGLAAWGGGAGEEERVGGAVAGGHGFVHEFVEEESVVVVHADRVGAVVVLDVFVGDALAEVGFEGVDAEVHEAAKVSDEPVAGGWVGEVDDGHARLPEVPLPDGPVGAFDEVALLLALLEEGGRLAHVRVDPGADAQPALFQAREVTPGVGEHLGIELKVAPLVGFHPEAIKVEHAEGDVAVPEAIQEAGDGLFVVVGREACGQHQQLYIFYRKKGTHWW